MEVIVPITDFELFSNQTDCSESLQSDAHNNNFEVYFFPLSAIYNF